MNMENGKIDFGNMGGEEAPEAEIKEEATSNAEEEKLNKLEAEVIKLKGDLLSALAENENVRKRHAKEREELAKFATSSALKELAVPFENLFSALKIEIPEELKENPFATSLLAGVTMVKQEFEKTFAKLGLNRINPEGEKFDPNLHQAVAQVEIEGVESGVVASVVSAGFELNGRVLKPAMVVVAK